MKIVNYLLDYSEPNWGRWVWAHPLCDYPTPDLHEYVFNRRVCTTMDAVFQNRIILHDNTLNLPVVVGTTSPNNPNYALHATVRLVTDI